MWPALDNVTRIVAPGGRLFIAIYNHQVYWSRLSWWMKRAYVLAPSPGKLAISIIFFSFLVAKGFLKDILFLRSPLRRYLDYRKARGMSRWHDCVDWVGGYPFEVAKPEEIFEFFYKKGFALTKIRHAEEATGAMNLCSSFSPKDKYFPSAGENAAKLAGPLVSGGIA